MTSTQDMDLSHIAILVDNGSRDVDNGSRDQFTDRQLNEQASRKRNRTATELAGAAAALQELGLAAAGFRIGHGDDIPCRHDYRQHAIVPEPTLERLLLARRAVRDHLGPAGLAVTPPAVIVFSGYSVPLFGDEYVGDATPLDRRFDIR